MDDKTNLNEKFSRIDNSENVEKMTPQVFQKKLWTWLQEKGIFSEMKTHLRRQMIDVLSASEIGPVVSSNQKSKRSLSPKYKAINLLIAEYLLQQGYQYALSIFTVEDPTLSILPEKISNNFIKPESDDRKDAVFKFLDEDVCDILETLGFPRDSCEVRKMFASYNAPMSKDTLFVCLIRSLSASANLNKGYDNKFVNDKMISKQTKTTQTIDDFTESSFSNQTAHELHQQMQTAFDRELGIVKKNERKKYRNYLKNIETEMTFKLKKEKDKLRHCEIEYQNNLLKEFEVKFQRLQEKERIKEIEVERNLQKDLEIEKKKLLHEYRSVAQEKNVNSSVLMELQQASLEAAIKAVQHQSSRLRKKENKLDQKLSNMNNQTYKEKIEPSFQMSGLNSDCVKTNFLLKKFENKAVQTIVVSVNSVTCQFDNNNITSVETVQKEINTKIKTFSVQCQTELQLINFQNKTCSLCSKKNQTSTIATSTCDLPKIHVLNPDQPSAYNDKVNFSDILQLENLLPSTLKNQKKFDEYHHKIKPSSNSAQIISSIQSLLKNLQSENISLKSQIQQQQNHIQELINKHSSMCKEVSEARIEAQELSNQMLQLEKVIDTNCKSPQVQEGLLLKKSRSIFNIEDKEERTSKLKKTDFKFTDRGLEKIKETLKLLEREGEELDKSYRAFKLRQMDDYEVEMINTTKKDEKLDNNSPFSISLSSVLLNHLKDARISREKYQTKDQSLDSQYTSDYVKKFNINSKRVHGHLMNLDRNILQNYETISKETNMHNSKNSRAFADIIKQRFLGNKKGCLNNVNAIAPLYIPKTSYSNRNHSLKILEKHLSAKEEVPKRKYQLCDPKFLSDSKIQPKLISEKTNSPIYKIVDDHLDISDKFRPNSYNKTSILLVNKTEKLNIKRPTNVLITSDKSIKTNRKWAKLNLKNIHSNLSCSQTDVNKQNLNAESFSNKADSIDVLNKNYHRDFEDIIKQEDEKSVENLIDVKKDIVTNQYLKINSTEIKKAELTEINESLNISELVSSNDINVREVNEICNIDSTCTLENKPIPVSVETSSFVPLSNREFQNDTIIENLNDLEKISNENIDKNFKNSQDNTVLTILSETIDSLKENVNIEMYEKNNDAEISTNSFEDVPSIKQSLLLDNNDHISNEIYIEDKHLRKSNDDSCSSVIIDNNFNSRPQGIDQNYIEESHLSSNSSPASNKMILSSSMDESNNSHISVPKDSDKDDSFWN